MKKLGLALLGALAILVVPSFLYGLLTDSDDSPSWMGGMTMLLLLLYIVGITIYLAVDAALRHQQRD